MRNVHIPGAVRDVGAKQGYEPLSALYSTERHGASDVPVIKLAYEPSPEELQQLQQGGRLVLTMVGVPGSLVPHRLEVSTA